MKLPESRDSWRRIAVILDRALELPSAERAAFLDQACAGSAVLKSEVEEYLEADEEAGPFLETPIGEYVEVLLAEPRAPAGSGRTLAGRRLGPYRVIREIGGGGMGVVFEGWDTRLERRVALKLLPPEWSRSPVAKERFVREARAAAALDHPNICTVYDVGESDDGQLFIVMPCYQGETLERRIARGPLPAEDARELAAQVARGLERAHASGIVHRDVKPSNVMVTSVEGRPDRAKILDFGIARIVGEAGLTRDGASPGTPAYMSPEQVSGGPIDGRTDVWSLGAMLYEMLTGRRPFRGDDEQAVRYAILHRDPEPPGQAAPPELARVVERALAKDPAARYQQLGDLLAELDPEAPRPGKRWLRLAAAALFTSLALVGIGWFSRQALAPSGPPEAAAEAAVPVVGVVPFTNRTGDPELDWYGEGTAQLVTDALAPSRHLQVVSTLRVEPLREIRDPLERARRAAEGGIGFLLTGEILPAGEGLILAARLVGIGDGRQLASRRIDAPEPEALLQAADEIAREVRKGLGVPPTDAVDVFAADFAAANPAAYKLYVDGLEAFVGFRYDAAERAFAAALEEAPDFTMARYRLAHIAAVTGRTDEALAGIRQAVAEADGLPDREARYVRALEAYIARRYDEAVTAYREILERYPYETEAASSLARVLHATGRYREALEALELLARLEPENHLVWSQSGAAHLALGDLHQAILDFLRYVELEPGSANGHHLLADAYRAQGELDLAAAEYASALELDPDFHFATVALAVVDALRDRREAAEHRLRALVADLDGAPRYRIDAAFELASLYRSEGRFQLAAETLAALEEIIAGEGVREALALAVRGTSRMELGDREAASRLIDLAVERSPSPGVPTRYLFARGLLELRSRRFAALEETVARILRAARPAEDPDRTEEKAAAYLRGMARLAAGEIETARAELTRAVALEGYEYASYRLGLARAYLAAGQLREAMAAARQAAREVDLTDPRLDLELDRVRALLLLAQVQEALRRPAEAATHAREFLTRWANADPGLAELVEARRLAGSDGPTGLRGGAADSTVADP
jgi:serine/threonine-protein kinase